MCNIVKSLLDLGAAAWINYGPSNRDQKEAADTLYEGTYRDIDREKDSYSTVVDTLGVKSQNSWNQKRVAVGLVITVVALVAISGLLTYALSPHVQTWVNNHIFSSLAAKKMTVKQGLLMLALPISGSAALISIALYRRHKCKIKHIAPIQEESMENSNLNWKKGVAVATGIALLVFATAGAACLYHYVPGVRHALNHKLTLGKNLLYLGLPTVGVSGSAIGWQVYRHRKEMDKIRNPDRSLYSASDPDNGDGSVFRG